MDGSGYVAVQSRSAEAALNGRQTRQVPSEIAGIHTAVSSLEVIFEQLTERVAPVRFARPVPVNAQGGEKALRELCETAETARSAATRISTVVEKLQFLIDCLEI